MNPADIICMIGTSVLFVVEVYGQQSQSPADISKVIDKETKPAGSEGRLNCTVTGVDQAGGSVMWSKLGRTQVDTVLISRGQQIVKKNPLGPKGLKKYDVFVTHISATKQIYSLAIRRIISEDSGKYECKIYLPGLDAEKLPVARGDLVVQLPPNMMKTDITPSVQAVEGSNAKLTCDATGVPKPRISWSRSNGKAMPDGQQTVYGTEILLTNVSSIHGGVYRCKADNNVRPPATMDITLQIRTKPVARAFRGSYGQARDKNLEVELACLISGDPQPDLFWYKIKNKETMAMSPISDDNKHEVNKIGIYPGHNRGQSDQWLTLRILQLQSGDYGTYMCLGKNKFGNGSAFIVLYLTPTCQGPLCQFQSRYLGGGTTLSVSVTLLLFALGWAHIMLAKT
ncbi:lachesin-like [Lineus longissimus]|uniref:lachesin-like n=1 Tax=Lineus longissimus TaxID=88925 RepID=UPI002B4DBD23